LDKIESLRNRINSILLAQTNAALRAAGWVHLYAVSHNAELLALRRGLDADICAAAGLLHDIHTYRTGEEANHAQLGAAEAPAILGRAGEWAPGEIDTIAGMISRHSDKNAVDGPYDECLKDADVFAHWMYDRGKKFDAARKGRLERIFDEFGISGIVREE
jgi:uncharacterized protein